MSEVDNIVLSGKVGCIAVEVAKRLNIEPVDALVKFYQSNTCNHLHNKATGTYLYSDKDITQEFLQEHFFFDFFLGILEKNVGDDNKFDINTLRAGLKSKFLQKLNDVVFGDVKKMMARFEVHQAIESAKCSVKAYCIKNFPMPYKQKVRELEVFCKGLEEVVCDVLWENGLLIEG